MFAPDHSASDMLVPHRTFRQVDGIHRSGGKFVARYRSRHQMGCRNAGRRYFFPGHRFMPELLGSYRIFGKLRRINDIVAQMAGLDGTAFDFIRSHGLIFKQFRGYAGFGQMMRLDRVRSELGRIDRPVGKLFDRDAFIRDLIAGDRTDLDMIAVHDAISQMLAEHGTGSEFLAGYTAVGQFRALNRKVLKGACTDTVRLHFRLVDGAAGDFLTCNGGFHNIVGIHDTFAAAFFFTLRQKQQRRTVFTGFDGVRLGLTV